MVSYYHAQYQEKLMIQSWENLVTNGWTERWTEDDSDFIGHYPTKVEFPKWPYKTLIIGGSGSGKTNALLI